MIRITILVLLACFTRSAANAQNLVPNPGFENTNAIFCGIFMVPDFTSSMNNWYNPTGGTPDVFSTQINQSCWNYQPNSTYPGPICTFGTQMPRSGNVFAGQFYYTIPGFNQREYIQTQLLSPLTPGHTYCVEFYVSMADNSEKYSNRIGAHFSDSAITSGTSQPLAVIPQVSTTSFITNTVSWVLVSGTFQPTTPVNYLTIGNFYDDANTSTLINPSGGTGPGCYGSYYFIDDVSVVDCTVGLEEFSDIRFVNISPNPVSDEISISFQLVTAQQLQIDVVDVYGRKVINLHDAFTQAGSFRLSRQVQNLKPGCYFVFVGGHDTFVTKFLKH